MSLGLFRGQISGGAHHRTGLSQIVRSVARESPRYTEIGNFYLPACSDQHISWFDVAVNNTVAMSERQGRGNIDGNVRGTVRMQRPLGPNDFSETPAFNVFHHDVIRARLLPPVVHADNVGLI